MADYRSKLDKDTRAILDRELPGYDVVKTKDHYVLEYMGKRLGIVAGNDTKHQRRYRPAKLRRLVSAAQTGGHAHG